MAPNAPGGVQHQQRVAGAPGVHGSRVAEGAGQNVRVDPRDPLEDEFASEPDVAQRHVR